MGSSNFRTAHDYTKRMRALAEFRGMSDSFDYRALFVWSLRELAAGRLLPLPTRTTKRRRRRGKGAKRNSERRTSSALKSPGFSETTVSFRPVAGDAPRVRSISWRRAT